MSTDDSDDLVIDEQQSLESCPFKFTGVVDKKVTEQLILNIENFILKNNIREKDVLKDLHLIFEGPCKLWWNEIKNAVKSWNDVTNLMRYVYAPSRPSHLIYSEIFQSRQENGKIEDYIRKLKTLFSQLPKPLPERQQIDMIYFTFNHSIRSNNPRESFETFDELIGRINSGNVTIQPKAKDIGKSTKKRQRCNLCKARGHIADDCRRGKKPSMLDDF